MFVMVVVGGLKLLVSYVFDRCSSLVIVCVLGMVIGVMMVLEVFFELFLWFENILFFLVILVGFIVVIFDLILFGKKFFVFLYVSV